MTKRAQPACALPPDRDALMERLWCNTNKMHATIADEVGVTVEYVRNAAKQRGWKRPPMTGNEQRVHAVEERLHTAAWLRWAEPKREVDRVRLVAPGTHPLSGFSMIGAGGAREGV